MGKQPLQRYRDIDVYVKEIEEVYDLSLEFQFDQHISAVNGLQWLAIEAYDCHDIWRSEGPLLYHKTQIPAGPAYKRQQGIIRALTSITYQCLELYASRQQNVVE